MPSGQHNASQDELDKLLLEKKRRREERAQAMNAARVRAERDAAEEIKVLSRSICPENHQLYNFRPMLFTRPIIEVSCCHGVRGAEYHWGNRGSDKLPGQARLFWDRLSLGPKS